MAERNWGRLCVDMCYQLARSVQGPVVTPYLAHKDPETHGNHVARQRRTAAGWPGEAASIRAPASRRDFQQTDWNGRLPAHGETASAPLTWHRTSHTTSQRTQLCYRSGRLGSMCMG